MYISFLILNASIRELPKNRMNRSIIRIEISGEYCQQIIEPTRVVVIHKHENIWVFFAFVYSIELLHCFVNISRKPVKYRVVPKIAHHFAWNSTF